MTSPVQLPLCQGIFPPGRARVGPEQEPCQLPAARVARVLLTAARCVPAKSLDALKPLAPYSIMRARFRSCSGVVPPLSRLRN